MKKVVLGSLIVVLSSCSGGKNSTGFSIINDMMYSEAYEAQTVNNVFDNGQTNQLAPKGTVARGFKPHPMDDEGNPIVLKNPHVMTDYAWERGKMLFEATCSACHGTKGKADGLVVLEGGFPKPPSFSARKWKKAKKYPSGYVYNVITFGYGNMASHAQQLYPKDRWYVSEFVREKLMKKKKRK
ncbi:MAG: c-type cytochrome [Bacteriovoracaceae bacterium]|jgi:mono/diheme cytochrome c family protein|nr:c-type cytochrome [Bacteriovoracaceae bacterium]